MKLVIPYIEGDGVGPEVVNATRSIVSEVVDVEWIPIDKFDYDTIRKYGVCLKGPTATPVGEGHRSYNVKIRQDLDLYACIRPIVWYGNPSPVRDPQKLDVVVFRENTEDVYGGIEFDYKSFESEQLRIKLGIKHPCAIGIKVISEFCTKRLMKMACEYAMKNNRKHITVVHKGNIMKYTEGGFLRWCLEVSKDYPEIVVDSCICDAFFQNALIHPERYDIVVAPNLNGDYISDALAAQVGGVEISPGVNTNGEISVYEATHGTAPDIAGKGLANPSSCLLSACMLLEDKGYTNESNRIKLSLINTIRDSFGTQKTTQEWVDSIIKNI